MKHVFLTGAVQCGKSTVVSRVLEGWAGAVGGFRTGFGPDRACPERLLYLWRAAWAWSYRAGSAARHR